MPQHSQETIDYLVDRLRLINEIEYLEAELEEQKDFLLKLQQDEEFEGNDNSKIIRTARSAVRNMANHLNELRLQLKETEQAEEDGDVLVTIGDRSLSVPIFSLENV